EGRRFYASDRDNQVIYFRSCPMKGSYVLEPAPAAPVHDGGENRELLARSRRPPYQPTGDLEGGAGFRASGRLPPARPDAKGRAADAGGKGAGATRGDAVCGRARGGGRVIVAAQSRQR